MWLFRLPAREFQHLEYFCSDPHRMKVRLILFTSLLLGSIYATAQPSLIHPFIRAWKVADATQTHVAQAFYDSLLIKRADKDYQQHFHRVVDAMYAYLEDHPDKRLEARTIIYEALGAIEYNYPRDPFRIPLEKAMSLALDLGDKQLLAEVYALYSYLPEKMVYPLYNLKAIELQRQVGFEHFCYVQNRFFDASRALYFTRDFRQAITYGQECLQFKDRTTPRQDPAVFIFQLDILGACYRELGIYDSVNYYYEQLEKELPSIAYKDSLFLQLWKGIARGNRGHVLALQGTIPKHCHLSTNTCKTALHGKTVSILLLPRTGWPISTTSRESITKHWQPGVKLCIGQTRSTLPKTAWRLQKE